MAFAFKASALPNPSTPYNLMQVVIPAGTWAELSGIAVDLGAAGLPKVACGVGMGVPEPGTIVLLIAGALCLVVARFRK